MDLKRERLAELILHLAGCSASQAIAAVDGAMRHPCGADEDSLEIVARAMVLVRGPVDLRENVDLSGEQPVAQDANVGGLRSAHGAADSS
jgi:hypothetical protein